MKTQIFATGIAITTSDASASADVPTTLNGTKPKYVRVAATAAACVKIGPDTVTATTDDVLVQPGDAVILAVSGATKIAAIQVADAGVVQVSPLEDS